jgi:hypothetical protein
MRHTTAVACLTALLAAGSPAFGQTGDGFVGVFGDAAGTIQCAQAPPYVPTTLYVLAKTAGATSSGITGAEFRIEFSNPSGYFLSYTAPNEAAVTVGDPLGAGFNISFAACQVPVAGIVSLGTISVFNIGTGSGTDIIVKRRSAPTNPNYPCALLVHCDAPVYSKTCNTAPADSISCLTEKAGQPPVVQADEYRTYLDGSPLQAITFEYEGYKLTSCSGYDLAYCTIERWDLPSGAIAVDSAVWAWVGIDRVIAGADNTTWRWMQAGWGQPWGYTHNFGYREYVDKNASRHFTWFGAPGSTRLYGVEKDANGTIWITVDGVMNNVGTWDDIFGQSVLSKAQYGVECWNSADHTPGLKTPETSRCHFSNGSLREAVANAQSFAPAFSNPETRSHSGIESTSNGNFTTWYEP